MSDVLRFSLVVVFGIFADVLLSTGESKYVRLGSDKIVEMMALKWHSSIQLESFWGQAKAWVLLA